MDHHCQYEKEWGRLNGTMESIDKRLGSLDEKAGKMDEKVDKLVVDVAKQAQQQKDTPTVRQQVFFASVGGGIVVFGGLALKFLWEKL